MFDVTRARNTNSKITDSITISLCQDRIIRYGLTIDDRCSKMSFDPSRNYNLQISNYTPTIEDLSYDVESFIYIGYPEMSMFEIGAVLHSQQNKMYLTLKKMLY